MTKHLPLLTCLLVFSGLFANPSGNAFDPVIFEEGVFDAGKSDASLRLGYVGDFVMDRKQQVRNQKTTPIEIAQRDFNGAEATLNLYNRFDLFARFGYASTTTRWNLSDAETLKLTSQGDFAWGCGFKALLQEWQETALTLNGSYMWGNCKLQRAEITGPSISQIINVLNQRVTQREKKWSVGVSIGHQIENFTPYLGLEYIQDKTHFRPLMLDLDGDEEFLPSLTSRKKIGPVIGLGIMAGKKASLNLEGRFFNQSALTLTGQARF